ncbi:LOB domain-containing protein 36 [Raphanus sativus]|nr:LOB domain-containing protein 36 [Raphanus sativus]
MELCAICKEERQKCTQKCVLTPYLPANKPESYACLVYVFDVKNLVRILKEIDPSQRQACVDSLCFEAEARIRDPVNGTLGIIRDNQRRIQHLQREQWELLSLRNALRELAMNHGRSRL